MQLDVAKKNMEVTSGHMARGFNGRQLKVLSLRHKVIAGVVKELMPYHKTILDIGARDGMLVERLNNAGYNRVFGYELCPAAVEKAKEKNLSVQEHDISGPMYWAKPNFDMIIISHCLEHCADVDRAARNIFNLLRPTGFLYVEVPIEKPGNRAVQKHGHVNFFQKPDQVLSVFENNGKWRDVTHGVLALDSVWNDNKNIRLVLRRV